MTEYKDNAFIEKYIPSPEVKEALYESNRVFSDWEKATIIWNSSLDYSAKLRELELLRNNTLDEALMRQIDERIIYEQDVMKLFKENNKGFVYVLYSYEMGPEGYLYGYYGSFDLAWKDGIDAGYDMEGFCIKKHQILNDDSERLQGKIVFPAIDKNGSSYKGRVVEMNLTEWKAGEMVFNEKGDLLSFDSSELSIERACAVNDERNSRFEYSFVDFPNPFKQWENVRIIGLPAVDDEVAGAVVSTQTEWQALIDEAGSEKSENVYKDARICVLEWGPELQYRDLKAIMPIYLTRDDMNYCNSLSDRNKVMIGHDYGAAVWIQPVNIDIKDRITNKCVHEVGMKLSIDFFFFMNILQEGFMKFFDPKLEVNAKRYTKAFSDGGRYLTGFEIDVLEPNFFTYEEIKGVIDYYEKLLADFDRWYYSEIELLDARNVIKVMELLKKMLKLCPDADYISVMS